MHYRAAADNVLAHHWDGAIPVDVESIATHIGAVVLREPLRGNSGEVEIVDGTPVIRVDEADGHTRQRFTIAHELGHLMLDHVSVGKMLRDPSKNYTLGNFDPKERDANYFASALLMPDDAVLAYVNGMTRPDISSLAQAFDVSPAAMGIKLKLLGIIPSWATV